MKAKITTFGIIALGSLAFSRLADAGATSNVNVVNTPNVNVANTPTVNVGNSVGVSGTISVGNDTAHPVPVRDMDNPARQPFTYSQSIEIPDGSPSSLSSAQVPAGKRLVVEQVSVQATITSSTTQKLSVGVETIYQGTFTYYFFTGVDAGNQFVASSQMRCYADGNTLVTIRFNRTDTTSSGFFLVSISGYLIDVP